MCAREFSTGSHSGAWICCSRHGCPSNAENFHCARRAVACLAHAPAWRLTCFSIGLSASVIDPMLVKTLRGISCWLPEYLRVRRPPPPPGLKDILICVCDHFEPFHKTDQAGALARMKLWRDEFPKIVESFRDSDGNGPR